MIPPKYRHQQNTKETQSKIENVNIFTCHVPRLPTALRQLQSRCSQNITLKYIQILAFVIKIEPIRGIDCFGHT